MDETIQRLTQAQQAHEDLAGAAKQAQAQQAGEQDAVAQALAGQNKELQGLGGSKSRGQYPEFLAPHAVLTSAAGIAAVAQGPVHIASEDSVAISSTGHTSVSTRKSFLASAKEAVKLFACKAGIKLVAAAGDIDLSALKDSVNILAKLNVTQVGNRIEITGKEEVVINGCGSFTRWNGSGITHGTDGVYRTQAASYSYVGPANAPPSALKSLDVALKETPPEDQIIYATQHVPDGALTTALHAMQPCTLLKNGAEIRKGLFDEHGCLTLDKVEKGAVYQVKLHNGTIHDIPVAQDRLAADPSDPMYDEHQLSNQGYRADGLSASERRAQYIRN